MPRERSRSRSRSPRGDSRWTFVREGGKLMMFNNRRRRSRSPFERNNRGMARQRSPFRGERERERDRSPPRGPRGPGWRGRSRSPPPMRERGPPMGRFQGANSWRRGRSPSPGSGKTSEVGSRRQSPRRSPPPMNRYRPAPGGDLIRDRPLSDRVGRERENTRSPFVGRREESLGRDTGSINSRSTPRERSPDRRDISPMSRDRDAPPPRDIPRARSPPPLQERRRSPSPREREREREPVREPLQIRGRARSPPRGPAQPFRAPTGPREGQRFGEGRFGFDGPPSNNGNGGYNNNKRPSFAAGGANAIPVRSPNPTMARHNSAAGNGGSATASAPASAPTGPAAQQDFKTEDVEGSVERHKGAIVWTSKHAQPQVPSVQPAAQRESLNASAISIESTPSSVSLTNKVAEPKTTITSTNSMNTPSPANMTTSTAPPSAPAAPAAKVSPPIAPRGFVPSGPRGGMGGGYRGARQSFSTDRRPSYTPSENNNANTHNSGWGAAPAAPRAALGSNINASNAPAASTASGGGNGANTTTPATPKATMASPSVVNPSPSPARTPIHQTPTQPRSQTPTLQTPSIPTGPRASLSAASGQTYNASASAAAANNNSNAMDWSSTGPATVATPIRRESSVSVSASLMQNNANANAPVNAPSGPAAQTQSQNGGWGQSTPSATPTGPAAQTNTNTGWGAPAPAPRLINNGWSVVNAAIIHQVSGWNIAFAPSRPVVHNPIHPALASIAPLIPGGKIDNGYTGLSKEVEGKLQRARDEEESLRRQVDEREEVLRRGLRGWRRGEREECGARLRGELSGGWLEVCGGEGEGGRGF